MLAGHVVRAADGSAAAGAEVRLEAIDSDHAGFRTRTTQADAKGKFGFDGVLTGRYRVLAQLDGLSSRRVRYRATKFDFDAAHPADLELKLSPAPSIRVHVAAKADGSPVAGAKVELVLSDTRRDFRTDAEGSVVLPGLTPENWHVEVQARGFAQEKSAVKLSDDQQADLNFALEPGGRLLGVVSDEKGRPLSGVGLSLRTADEHDRQIDYMESQADGSYHFEFLPLDTNLELAIYSPDYQSPSHDVLIASQGVREVELDFALAPRPDGGSVEGVVTDSAGRPIAGANLTNTGNSSDHVRRATTDAAGRFRIDKLYEGSSGCQLVARAKGSCAQVVSATPRKDGAPAQVSIKLERGHRIRGRVVDTDGRPIADAYVTYAGGDQFDSLGGRVTTDAEGRFALDALPADCRFDIDAEDHSGLQDKTLPLDGPDEVVVTLQQPGVILGHVVDAKTGQPIQAFNVRITFSDDHQPGDPRGTLSTEMIETGWNFETGSNFESALGDFQLDHMTVGLPLQVMVEAPGFARECAARGASAGFASQTG